MPTRTAQKQRERGWCPRWSPLEQPALLAFDAMRELRINIDEREGRAHQACNMNRGFAQTKHRDIEQFPKLVQPGIEDVAEQEGVVTFLGPQPMEAWK
jgi:hypothetical protein